MAYRKILVGKRKEEFIFGGENVTFIDAQAEVEAFKRDVLARLRFEVDGDEEFNFEYPDDVYLRTRINDDGTFGEFFTRSLGEIPAYKTVSVNKDSEGKLLNGCFISFMAPWVRYNRDEQQTEVMYDSLQLKVDSEKKGELAELGFAEANVWYPVERAKMKTKANPKSHYVYKPL